jgi:adenylate kinase family enzyme
MKIKEIDSSDEMAWKTMTGNSLYNDYENLNKRYNIISDEYENSTQLNVVKQRLDILEKMKEEILKMYKFCKISKFDSETEEFIRKLKLMHAECRIMIEELERFL